MTSMSRDIQAAFSLSGETTFDWPTVLRALEMVVNSCTLMTLATTAPPSPAACTVYFAPAADLNDIWFLSETTTDHSEHIQRTPYVAASIFLPTNAWGDPIAGLQLLGTATRHQESDCAGAALYVRRFPAAGPALSGGFVGDFAHSRFHQISVTQIKLVNMIVFGSEEYVVLTRREK
jgi:hypothetical protein